MSYFKAKMHQSRFLLGLCSRPRWGSLQRSPDLLGGFPTSKGGEEGDEGREAKKGDGRGKERGRERLSGCNHFPFTPLTTARAYLDAF